jgi:hypothetical protein
MSNRKPQLLVVMIAMLIFLNSAASAQSSNGDAAQVKKAASYFFREYLHHFDYPFANERTQLNQYLSPRLRSLIRYELQRLKAWSAKNPDLKPPVVEDLFTCNHYDPPQGFHVDKASVNKNQASVIIRFEYTEKGKIIDRCKVSTIYVNHGGKWLLDNVKFDKDVDLITLLSRKEYSVLPKRH